MREFGDRHGAEPTWISLGVSLLNFQTRGAWTCGDHVLKDDELNRVYGWRKALATIHMGYQRQGIQVFTMRSAIANHMSRMI